MSDSLRQRAARRETDLNVTGPKEEVYAPRAGEFYPVDLTAQIESEERKRAYLAEIPGQIASSIESINAANMDRGVNLDIANKDLDIYAKTLEIEENKRAWELDTNNGLSSEIFRLSSEAEEAGHAAMTKGESVEAAMIDFTDNFKLNPGLSSPYALETWSGMFNKTRAELIAAGREADRTNAEALAQFNIQNMVMTSVKEMKMGTDLETAFMNFDGKMSIYGNTYSPESLDEMRRAGWSSLVYEKFMMIQEDQDATSDEKAKAIKDLMLDSIDKVLPAMGSDGKQILDQHGDPVFRTVTLTDTVRNQLEAGINSWLGRKSSGVELESIFSALNDKYGLDEFVSSGGKTNYSKGATSAAVAADWQQAYTSVINSGADTDKKTNMLKKIEEHMAPFFAATTLSELVVNSGGNIQPIRDAMTKLDNDLLNFEDMEDYSLELSDGKTLKLPHQIKDIMGGQSRKIWREISKYMHTQFDGNNFQALDFLAGADKEYGQNTNNLLSTIDINKLVANVGKDDASVSQQGIYDLTLALKSVREVGKKLGYVDDFLPEPVMQEWASRIYNAYGANESDKYQGCVATMKAIKSAGAVEALEKYLAGHRKVAGENAGASDKAGASNNTYDFFSKVSQLVYADGINEATALMTASVGAGKKSALAQLNSEALKSDISQYQADAGKLLESKKIPASRREGLAALALSLQEGALVKYGEDFNPTDTLKVFNKVLDTNFIKIPGVDSQAMYVHSPCFLYVSPKKVGESAQATLDKIRKKYNDIGYRMNGSSFTFVPDEATGQFFIALKGKDNVYRPLRIRGNGKDVRVGALITDKDLQGLNTDQVSDILAGNIFIQQLLHDTELQRKWLNNASVDNVSELLRRGHTSGVGQFARMIKGESYNVKTTSMKIKDYYTPDKLRTDLFILQYISTDPKVLKGAAFSTGADKADSKVYNKYYKPEGGSANFNLLLKGIYGNNPQVIRGLVPAYRHGASEMLKYRESQNKKSSADLGAELVANASYVGKVNQAGVSLPIAQAAIGNENFIDIYNAGEEVGLNIVDFGMPGVITSAENESIAMQGSTWENVFGNLGAMSDGEGITGAAAPVATTKNPPKVTGKKATRAEINEMIDAYSSLFNVDPKLVHAVIKHESGYNQYAKGKDGEIGLGQFMPLTAKRFGVEDRSDAGQNIWATANYLHQSISQYGLELGLVNYNGGPNAVKKWKEGRPLKLSKNYVRAVLGNYGSKNNPIQNGTYNLTYELKLNRDTGKVDMAWLNKFIDTVKNKPGFSGNIVSIETNRPELYENKPEYVDFAKYREMKGADGKPLFKKGSKEGLVVYVKSDEGINKLNFNSNATRAIADDMHRTQTDILGYSSIAEMNALIDTFKDRYNINPYTMAKGGLASLSKEEYESYGIPSEALNNPIMQARVLAQEYQRAVDILGSSNKAVFALAGGKLGEDSEGAKTWEEIKKDDDAYFKTWYMQPSAEAKEREAINTMVKNFASALRREREV